MTSQMEPVHEFLARAGRDAARKYGGGGGVPQRLRKCVSVGLAEAYASRLTGEGYWVAANQLEDLVGPQGSELPIWSKEVLLDLVLFQGTQHPYEPLLTIESEGYLPEARRLAAYEPPTDSRSWDPNGLLWDGFKLLLVPSPHRMFVARCDEKLIARLIDNFGRYLVNYARPEDDARAGGFSLVIVSPEDDPGPFITVAHWRSGGWHLQPSMARRALYD